MTTQNRILSLRRAGICYAITGTGYLIFVFPYWFFGAKDEPVDGDLILPFLFLVKNRFPLEASFWVAPVSIACMFVGNYSLWQVGEPTGFKSGLKWLILAMIGASLYLLGSWMPLPFAPLGALTNGISMILVGIATLKANIWTGWKRYTPLLVGIFPFVFMFPLLILTGARPSAMIGFWAFPWMALGFAAWQRSREINSLPSEPAEYAGAI